MTKMSTPKTSLPKGVYVPAPTFFFSNEDIDLPSLEKHFHWLINSGISGIVLLGSTGEAVHLTREERSLILRTGVAFLRKNAPDIKIIAGCGAQGLRPTLELIGDAAAEGAEYALILPPSYFRAQIGPAEVKAWFLALADASPLPIVIYNYPGVSQGVDLDPETLIQLAHHPNIVGLKATDANVGKIANLSARVDPTSFTILAGSADFFLPALTVGAVGCVPGLGNLCPRAIVEIQALYEGKQLEEASKLQLQVIKADDAMNRWHGVPGGKAVLQELGGYGGGYVRLPLLKLDTDKTQKCVEAVREAWGVELKLKELKK